MSKRLKKIIIIIVAALLILGGTAIAALYYLGDRIIEEVIRDDINLSANESGQAVQIDETRSYTDVPSGAAEDNTDISTEATHPTAIQQTNGESQTTQAAGGDSIPAAKFQKNHNKDGNGNSTKSTTEAKTVVINNDKIVEIKNEVTTEDKLAAAALVLKRLSVNDINELKDMMAGGLSEEEKARAKQLAYSRFTADELAKIKEMYSKYMK